MRQFGKEPLCNGKPERAPHIGGFCFPLCWRCTSIVVGTALIGLFNLDYCFFHPFKSLLLSFALMAPCLIDGVGQYFFEVESTNLKRIVTGLFAGAGFGLLSPFVSFVLEGGSI